MEAAQPARRISRRSRTIPAPAVGENREKSLRVVKPLSPGLIQKAFC